MKKIIVILFVFFALGNTKAQVNLSKQKKSNDFSLLTKVDYNAMVKNDIDRVLATGNVKLNRYFKADDGSIVCIRQIKDKVYAIADRMDRRFSSVWIGNIEGSKLKVKYFYISKGKAKGNGSLEFNVTGRGRGQTLALNTSGSGKLKSANFNFKSLRTLTQLPTRLPVDDRSWYRGNTLDNLTGRWSIKNVGEEYYLDLGKQVLIYTVGGRKTPNARPQFTSLFVGDRKGNSLEGFYVDLPLGHTNCFGNTKFKIVGPHFIRASYDHFYYGVDRERIKGDKNEILK